MTLKEMVVEKYRLQKELAKINDDISAENIKKCCAEDKASTDEKSVYKKHASKELIK